MAIKGMARALLMLWMAVAPAAAQEMAGARLVPQMGHNDSATSLVFAPDDRTVVTTGEDGAVILWHADSGSVLRRFEGHTDRVNAAAFSADGTRMVTVGNDLAAIVWDIESGRATTTYRGHGDRVRRVAFVGGGSRVVTTDDSGGARVWDADTGAEVHSLPGAHDRASWMAPSKKGGRVLTSATGGTIAVWDVDSGSQLTVVREDAGSIEFGTLSADGKLLVTAAKGGAPVLRAADTGTALLRFKGTTGLRDAAFSADGQWVGLIDGSNNAAVYSTRTGKRSAHMPNDGLARLHIAFSPDAGVAVTADGDGGATRWDLTSGRAVGRLLVKEAHWSSAEAVAFSHDGRRIATLARDGVLWDVATGNLGHVLRTRSAGVASAAFSPDGARIATASYDGAVAVWDLRKGRLVFRAVQHGAAARAIAWSPDGTRLVSGSLDQTLMVWEAATGEPTLVLRGHTQGVRSVSFSPDGRRLVSTAADGDVVVWDAETGEEKYRASTEGNWAVWAHLSADNSRLSAGNLDGVFVVWQDDGTTRTEVQRFAFGNALTYALSPDGQRLLTGGEFADPTLWDLRTGKAVRKHAGGHRQPVVASAFSPGGGQYATVGLDSAVVIWSASKGTVDGTLATDARFVSWSPDGRWLVTAEPAGTVRMWDARTLQERVDLLTFADGTWAVVDPAGRFDAAADGNVDGLAWVIGAEPYRLSQLRTDFYEPGLLARALGFRTEPLRTVPRLDSIAPPPAIRVDGPDAAGALRIQVEDRGGGVGDLFVRLNGSDITGDVIAQCGPLTAGATCVSTLARLPTWVKGSTNRVEVYVAVPSGQVRSRGTVREVVAKGRLSDDPPDLWVAAVGTGDYAGDAIDLRYPPIDAAKFSEAMRVAGERGFGADRTHVRVWSTGGDATPSPASLQDLTAWVSQADAGDTFVLYLSGHGVALSTDGVDDYFYLLPGAGSLDDLRDPAVRSQNAWSGAQIAAALASVPALKRAVIFDTCAAGKFDGGLATPRNLSADAVRAHARAHERTGAWFLAGAAADKVSYEASRFAQGLLTYTLLEGMRGPALADGDQLFVGNLFRYAEGQVPVYAQGIGGVQQPITRSGESPDFPIGALPTEARARVPLALPRPVVVRASISTADGRVDRLGVERAVNEALRARADGPSPAFVVWDTEPSDDTWQITGRYTEPAGTLKFDGFVTRSRSGTFDERPISVTGADAAKLAAAIVERVVATVAP